MNQKIIIESLSMDLLRAALGLHKGSLLMAERFEQEALKRSEELEPLFQNNQYIKTLILKTKKSLNSKSPEQAEELLMYSILFRNLVQSKYLYIK